MVGFNIISAHLSIKNSETSNPLVTLRNKYYTRNKLWPKWPSSFKHTTEQKKEENCNDLAVGPYFSQPQHRGASLGCGNQSGLLWKPPQHMSWTCASEQVIIFLAGMGQHFSCLNRCKCVYLSLLPLLCLNTTVPKQEATDDWVCAKCKIACLWHTIQYY